MVTSKRLEPAAVTTASELQIIEQFGLVLGIQDIAALKALRAADQHTIFTNPVSRGRAVVRYETATEVLLVSRQPLLDTARLLLSLGCKPDAVIARRRAGGDADDMRAPIGAAAQCTVDETRTVFAKWKPFCPSAGPATDAAKAKSAGGVASRVETIPEKGRRPANCLDNSDKERRRAE
jgi:hypothetical protein